MDIFAIAQLSCFYFLVGFRAFVSVLLGTEKMESTRYSLVWDNIQKLVTARGQGRQTANKMMLWANSFAAKSRVAFHESTTTSNSLAARDIPLAAYLPNADDYESLRQRMEIVVSRILQHHVPFFASHCSSAVIHHIPHEFTDKSALKSELVRGSVF